MEYPAPALPRQPPELSTKKPPLRMFLNLSGVFYLSNLWNALRSSFNLPLPSVCITMGFPSRRARSRASNRAPGEILVQEWKGSDIEKALVSIHPERFSDVTQVALSTLFVVGNEVYGSRRNLGSHTLGVDMDKQTGDLIYSADDKGAHAEATLNSIIKQLGAPPQGFAELPEPKQRQTTRMQKYVCNVCGKILRGAGVMGRVVHGDDNGLFVLQQTRQAAVPAQQSSPMSPENIQNVTRAVKAGVAKIAPPEKAPHGRMFGTEAAV